MFTKCLQNVLLILCPKQSVFLQYTIISAAVILHITAHQSRNKLQNRLYCFAE